MTTTDPLREAARGTVVPPPAPGARPPGPAVRRARVAVSRVDPWSVLKLAFLLSVALAVVTVVAVAVLWGILSAAGVFDSIASTVAKVAGSTTTTSSVTQFLSFSRVLGFTAIVAVVDAVLLTALATLGAFLFNLAAGLVGGVDVTLTEVAG